MALKVKCKCGKIYEIKPEWLGKRLRCKKCDHVIVLPKTVPKKKTSASGTASAQPTKRKAATKKAAVASGGLDDLLGGDLAALEQSAATVETTRKPPPKKAASTAFVPGGGGHTSMDRKSAERAASLTGIRQPESTHYLAAIIAGVVAGACGAGVWAAIAYNVGLEIGWIAWGIGAVVGLAMIAVGREGSALLGICSVVIVVFSLFAGKLLTVHMLVADLADGGLAEMLELTNDDYIATLADEVATAQEEAGEEVIWPEPDFDEDLPQSAYYPPDVWREATAEWNDMGADGQLAYKQEFDAEIGGLAQGAMVGLGFFASFGLFDVVFFGLAMATSFKITVGGIGD